MAVYRMRSGSTPAAATSAQAASAASRLPARPQMRRYSAGGVGHAVRGARLSGWAALRGRHSGGCLPA